MAIGFDESNPGDSDIVSQYPTNERAQRSAVASAWAIEHDDTAGRNRFERGNTSARDAITNWTDRNIYVNTSASSSVPIIQIYTSATSSWSDTGRFTSADEAKLDGIASGAQAFTTATSAEAAGGTVSAVRAFSPYLVHIAASAVTSVGLLNKPTTTDFQTKASVNTTLTGMRMFTGQASATSAGALTVTFVSAFASIQGIVCTPIDTTTGVVQRFLAVDSFSNSNFLVRQWDHNGNLVSGLFSWIAWGKG